MWKWIFFLVTICSLNLNAEVKVLAFAGSAREESVNKKLVGEAARWLSRNGARVTMIDLKDYPIPFYNEDLESKEGMPFYAKKLRCLMVENQVIMIASPEYNGSLSPLLKNVIDWASRGEQGGPSREAFTGKVFVLMSASPGQKGGASGLVHLREILKRIGATVFPEELIVPDAYQAFDEKGGLKSEKVKGEMQNLLHKVISLQ